MIERKYENSLLYAVTVVVIGVIAGLMAVYASILYPIFSIYKKFISEILLFTSIDTLPNDIVLIMAFPLYWTFFILLLYTPIDRMFKYREKFESEFIKVLKATIKDIFISLTKLIYYTSLFTLCYFISIWLTNNVLTVLPREQSLTIIPFIFVVSTATFLFKIINSIAQKKFPRHFM